MGKRPFPGGRDPRLPGNRKEDDTRINNEIIADQVRLVTDEGESEIVSLPEALARARVQELDLVEISGKAIPPVVKIIDYTKYLFEKKKKDREMKSKTAKNVVKEIRFGPNTDDHDFDFKIKHAKAFLEEGDKVRAYVHFKGRAIVYKDRGELLLLRFAQDLEELAKVEQAPKLEGKRMYLLLAPKSAKKVV